jgi:hypothetical protein
MANRDPRRAELVEQHAKALPLKGRRHGHSDLATRGQLIEALLSLRDAVVVQRKRCFVHPLIGNVRRHIARVQSSAAWQSNAGDSCFTNAGVDYSLLTTHSGRQWQSSMPVDAIQMIRRFRLSMATSAETPIDILAPRHTGFNSLEHSRGAPQAVESECANATESCGRAATLMALIFFPRGGTENRSYLLRHRAIFRCHGALRRRPRAVFMVPGWDMDTQNVLVGVKSCGKQRRGCNNEAEHVQ